MYFNEAFVVWIEEEKMLECVVIMCRFGLLDMVTVWYIYIYIYLRYSKQSYVLYSTFNENGNNCHVQILFVFSTLPQYHCLPTPKSKLQVVNEKWKQKIHLNSMLCCYVVCALIFRLRIFNLLKNLRVFFLLLTKSFLGFFFLKFCIIKRWKGNWAQ